MTSSFAQLAFYELHEIRYPLSRPAGALGADAPISDFGWEIYPT